MSIIIKDLYHTYQSGSPNETHALKNINLEIREGDFIGLIGHTGSGKSTLVQHLNGLLKPSKGEVIVDDINISQKGTKLTEVRKKVGLVFQYPEHQLFEETVLKDVSFGPQNLGLSEEEVSKRVKKAIKMVNLDFNKIKNKSPFNLSGGQKRRVAIAGVLAMEPKYLVLDEPTAGLDPQGRDEILTQIKYLHEQLKITIILVSHSMDDIAPLANRLIVMRQGQVEMEGTPREVFQNALRLKDIGLGVPTVTQLLYSLKAKGLDVKTDLLDIFEAKDEILRVLGKGRKDYA
ncbi:MAG: energy-coupling factor transporter ATPase [Clostridia bacterium]|jgi:energy-coupling factor transport system ATP-binding protein|nr:energy-coupling factor transporter ATPase [Clostridia bacterium]